MENSDVAWKKQKKESLKMKIENLARKIVETAQEIRRLEVSWNNKSGMNRHWRKMGKLSLRATRKKIYKCKAQLENL